MMNFKQKFLHSPIARIIYKAKFYIDVGTSQISFITGKLTELMALLYLLDKFGYSPSELEIILIFLGVLTALLVFGIVWKHTGLYDTAQYVVAEKDPVQVELLESARIIKRKYRGKRR